MPSRHAYDLSYRWWSPWDAVGVRSELRELLDRGDVDAARYPRAVDLGCGTGANVVHLAQHGFRVTGIDFSSVALDKARRRAADAGVSSRCAFIEGDLTVEATAAGEDPFDLLIDFGSIDDLAHKDRPAVARLVERLSHPGSRFLFWCWYARKEDLPLLSLVGPSRLGPRITPGEETELFGGAFDIEPFGEPSLPRTACFLLTRRALTPSTHEGAHS